MRSRPSRPVPTSRALGLVGAKAPTGDNWRRNRPSSMCSQKVSTPLVRRPNEFVASNGSSVGRRLQSPKQFSLLRSELFIREDASFFELAKLLKLGHYVWSRSRSCLGHN
jgi:hypothetical protein